MMVRDRRAAMRALVRRLAATESFDVVHADQLNMAQYALQVPGARHILDAHNALWVLYGRLATQMRWGPQRLMLERDWRLLRRYEGRVVMDMDGVLAVSDEDRGALLSAARHLRDVTVIPIAVDTDELTPVERLPEADHLLHIGTMYWPPNIDGINWFLDEILPEIVRKRPGTVFDIVGARPPEALLARAQEDHHLTVPGYVEDTLPYLRAAGVFLVPLRAGGGMRVKILNALAQGMPIVSTTLGAEGIAVRNGEHLLLADEPADFAAAVLRLLRNPGLAARLGAAGRRLVEERYDYRVACAPIVALYEHCLEEVAS
jgi:glycosyltransferase involved in cell wall biosynthesis